MHVKNKKFKMFRSSYSNESECSIKFPDEKTKEELTFIKSKVKVYDNVFILFSLVIVFIGIVIEISIMN